jgi:putative Mn2+ efflux pump MntP
MAMAMWEILVISVGLSLDVFAYSLWKGAMLSELKKSCIIKMTALFTGFQMGALLLGNAITLIPAIRDNVEQAKRLWILIAACIFFGIGVYMIVKSLRKKSEVIEEKKEDDYHFRVIVIWAFITSIDALLAGVSYGFLSATLMGTVLLTGITTAAAVLGGIIAGYRLGCGPKNTMVTIGGCIVIIGGIDVLSHFFI